MDQETEQESNQETVIEEVPENEELAKARSAVLRESFTAQPRKMSEQDEPEPPPEVQAPAFVLTKEDFDALAAKVAGIETLKEEQSKQFGSFGGTIRSYGQKIAALATPVAAPVYDITDEEIDGIKDDFPPLASVLTKLKTARPPVVDEEALVAKAREQLAPDLQRIVQESRIAARNELRHELLTGVHPDYQDVAASTDFRAFVKARGDDVAAKLDKASDEWDYHFIGKIVSEFKDATKKASDAKSTRQARLDSGVNPRGSAPPGPATKTQRDILSTYFKNPAYRG